jgi:hypothetical protein
MHPAPFMCSYCVSATGGTCLQFCSCRHMGVSSGWASLPTSFSTAAISDGTPDEMTSGPSAPQMTSSSIRTCMDRHAIIHAQYRRVTESLLR